jgi:transcriptional accessory protein Tex/SPT6
MHLIAGKLTAELKTALETADMLLVLEDLYLPFKGARCTHAETARAQGFGKHLRHYQYREFNAPLLYSLPILLER